jgi:hypothetical protein
MLVKEPKRVVLSVAEQAEAITKFARLKLHSIEEENMIAPTVGRIVWFYEAAGTPPLAAIVCHVTNDQLINLTVFGRYGESTPALDVLLLQDDDELPSGGHFAQWMPYQRGQAARLDAEIAKNASR